MKNQKAFTILILDNEQTWHDRVKNELEKYAKEKNLKIELIHAYNPQEALDLYEKNKPDLIISDVCMGSENHGILSDKDGIDKFVKPIYDKYKEQKIIVMSSSKDFNIAMDAFNAGAQHFVQKPYVEKLKEVLEKYEELNKN